MRFTQATKESLDQPGYIYFLISPDHEAVKVGFATNPAMRLSNLQTAHHENIHWETFLRGTRREEAAMHQRLKPHHIRREWFRYNDEMAEFIEDLQDAQLFLSIQYAIPESEVSLADALAVEDPKGIMDAWCEAHYDPHRRLSE